MSKSKQSLYINTVQGLNYVLRPQSKYSQINASQCFYSKI
jgi:hypothetical protein